MKKISQIYTYTLFFSLLLLFPHTFLLAESIDKKTISALELYEIEANPHSTYIYLGAKESPLYQLIIELSNLEDNDYSPLIALKQRIEDGFSIEKEEIVFEAIQYAEMILHKNYIVLSQTEVDALDNELTKVIDQLLQKPSITYNNTVALHNEQYYGKNTCDAIIFDANVILREDVEVKKDTSFKNDLFVKGRSNFCKKTEFYEDVKFHDKVKFKDKVKFDEDVTFEENVLIEGNLTVNGTVNFTALIQVISVTEATIQTLSVTDAVIQNASITDATIQNASITDATITNLSVTDCMGSLCVRDLSVVDESVSGTLSANNAVINNLTVTNISVSGCLASLCAIDLSVANESISGTLSVMDEIVQNSTITSLSATDAIIQDATITDLSVINCIANLCVPNLSVVDESVSGTLSVNDAIIQNGTITNLSATDATIGSVIIGCGITVGCNISMNDSISPDIGNIIKNTHRYIHNFGTDNVFMGVNAGNFTMAGTDNIGIGRNALINNTTGYENVAIGSFAMASNTTGHDNTALGYVTLNNNIQGFSNVAIGSFSLFANTGIENTAIGCNSGKNLNTGDDNVIIGNDAALNLLNGTQNVIIGYNSALNLITGDNNIYIGNAGLLSESGIIRIGTPAMQTKTFIQGINGVTIGLDGVSVDIDAAGQLGTVVSSKKFKHNIKEIKDTDSEIIYQLNPVTFVYNEDTTETKQYGLIAEEVAQVFPELIIRDVEEKPFTVRYQLLPVLLLNEVKKLHNIAQQQFLTIEELRVNNKKLGKIMNDILDHMHSAVIN